MVSKVANPAVIIGLGGTGQWVLTYLKKNLLDTYGEVPKTVRLLAFDTTSEQTEAAVSADKMPEEERAKVGNVSLGTGEFVYLGGSIKKYCEGIAGRLVDPQTGKPVTYPHIGSWLQAETYLQYVDDRAYLISQGAGQKRPFGRMAIFYDLDTGQRQILGKIETALTDVIKANERQQPIEIYITGSVAGGTGSGIFIDIAHIARKKAEGAGKKFAVRGFIVLQNTFDPVIKIQNIMPNAFAAMRELDRFMLVFNRDYPIYYSDQHRQPLEIYHSIHSAKLFDSCYLLDSVRTSKSLEGVEPKYGVYPSVAECITALLDPETGNTFSQHYVNVGNDIVAAQQEVARTPTEAGTAFYSSLGTFTYILPVVDIIERNTYKLALELLRDRLLTIRTASDGSLKVSGEGNRESQNPPREEAVEFLKMLKSRAGELNLHFNQQIADVLNSGRLKDPVYIQEIAAKGIELLSWLLPSEQDDVIAQTANDLQKAMEVSVIADVPNSKVYRDDFHAAADRIARDVQKLREQLLGREEAGGRKVTGDLQKGLDAYAKRNVERFRKLVIEKMADLLNGLTDDSLIARQGKLPYAQEWLGWLVQSYDEFAVFMREVVKTWTADNEVGQARDNVATTKQVMYDNRDAAGLFDKLQGHAIKAQDAYIGASNYLLDLERQEMLMRAIIDLADSFKAVAQQARSQTDQWLAILALGGSAESGEIGVYRQLLKEQGQLQGRRDEQKRIQVYDHLTDEKYEDELYSKYLGDDKWKDILRRFAWKVVPGGNGVQLELLYGDMPLTVQRTREDFATVLDAHLLMDKMRTYFNDIQNETIVARIREIRTADRAATEMLNSSGALISYEANEQPRAGKRNFICINEGIYKSYVDQLSDQLTASAPTAKENKVIGLSNKHRCVVLSTTDVLASKGLKPYQLAQQSYTQYSGDRRQLHIFPAEVNATWYEQRLTRPPLQQAQRLLSPRLVALLEDRDMVRRFVLSLFYGLVRVEESETEGQNQYVLRLERTSRRDMSSVIRLTPSSRSPDLLDAMTAFVYPRIDQETGHKLIYDVGLGETIGVEPERVDQTLQQRKESVASGRETAIDEFERRMAGWSDLFKPEGKGFLISALRRFVAENEREIKDGNEVVLEERLKVLMQNNNDCYHDKSCAELESKIKEVLREFKGDRIKSEGTPSIVARMENYIQEKIEPMHRTKLINQRPIDERPNQLVQDLYSVIHLVLWDEIERLEQLGK